MLIRTAGNRPVFSMPQDIDKREVPTVVFHIANMVTRELFVSGNSGSR
jgi:3-dehydroquinate dehydratase